MELLIGMLFITGIIFIISVQINEYNAIVMDRFRFEYFSLRDRLAILVIKGELDEDSWEYRHIVDSLNFHIHAVESMTITRVARFLAHHHNQPEQEKQLRTKKILNVEVNQIMFDFLKTTHKLLMRNSRYEIKIAQWLLKSRQAAHSLKARPVMTSQRAVKTIEDRMHHLQVAAAG